jgi:V8-like Glu-specific endopeptidase
MPMEFAKITDQYKSDDEVDGLMIDVRDNGGGDVTYAEDIVNYLRRDKQHHIERNKASFKISAFNKKLVQTNYEQIFQDWAGDMKGTWNNFKIAGIRYSQELIFSSQRVYDPDTFWWGDKPKILLTNARSYSATDSFAGCFKDNGCGVIIGENSSTGAGGANVFTYDLLQKCIKGNKNLYLPQVKNLVSFRVAIRRILRRKDQSGLPIEDLGVESDWVIHRTKNDYSNPDSDFFPATVAAAAVVRAKSESQSKAIYRVDTRREYYQLDEVVKQKLVGCVGAITDVESLEPLGQDTYSLAAGNLGQVYNLKSTELFWSQPAYDPVREAGVFGTAFLVKINGQEYLITAGHCFHDKNGNQFSQSKMDSLRIIFGFMNTKQDDKPTENIHKDRVYSIKNVLTCKKDSKSDWAICTLDRTVVQNNVTNIVPCEAISSGPVKVNTALICLGYPSGLPLKQSSGAVKVNDADKFYFKTDLTTFQGNSGSPVFLKDTNQIVGILVSGAVDYRIKILIQILPMC